MDKFQSFIGRIGKLLIAFHLKRSQVEQTGSILLSVFFSHRSHDKRQIFNAFHQCHPLFTISYRINAPVLCFLSLTTGLFFFSRQLFITFTNKGRESCITIHGFQFPILFRLKIFNIQLPVDDQCECRGLYSSDRKHLPILPIFYSIEPRGIHPQQPVTNSPGHPRLIKWLKILLIF